MADPAERINPNWFGYMIVAHEEMKRAKDPKVVQELQQLIYKIAQEIIARNVNVG